jgi:hypothetical protein
MRLILVYLDSRGDSMAEDAGTVAAGIAAAISAVCAAVAIWQARKAHHFAQQTQKENLRAQRAARSAEASTHAREVVAASEEIQELAGKAAQRSRQLAMLGGVGGGSAMHLALGEYARLASEARALAADAKLFVDADRVLDASEVEDVSRILVRMRDSANRARRIESTLRGSLEEIEADRLAALERDQRSPNTPRR